MSLTALKKKLERAKSNAEGMRKRAERTMEQVVTLGETTGGAFGFAYARARMGDKDGRLTIQGVDVDLLSGVALQGVALLMSDKWAGHAAAFGNGALSCYAVHKGAELGMRSKSKKTGASGRPALQARAPRMTDSVFDAPFVAQPVAAR